MVRLLGSGLPDPDFGVDGVASIPEDPSGPVIPQVIVQGPEGDYILAGLMIDTTSDLVSHVIVRRIGAEGTLDLSFGNQGAFIWPAIGSGVEARSYGAALQPDGRIIVSGWVLDVNEARGLVLRLYPGAATEVESSTVANADLLRVFPNPASGLATVRYSVTAADRTDLLLSDATGRTVRWFMNGEVRSAGTHSGSIDLSGLAPGKYLLTLRNSTVRRHQPVMIH
jgi:hypothetical protein